MKKPQLIRARALYEIDLILASSLNSVEKFIKYFLQVNLFLSQKYYERHREYIN